MDDTIIEIGLELHNQTETEVNLQTGARRSPSALSTAAMVAVTTCAFGFSGGRTPDTDVLSLIDSNPAYKSSHLRDEDSFLISTSGFTLINEQEVIDFLGSNQDLLALLPSISAKLSKIYNNNTPYLELYTDEEGVSLLYAINEIDSDDFSLLDDLENRVFDEVLLPLNSRLNGRIIFSQG